MRTSPSTESLTGASLTTGWHHIVKNGFKVKGTGSSSEAKVTYFAGTTNTTTKMTSSKGYAVTLQPGAFKLIRVKIVIAIASQRGFVEVGQSHQHLVWRPSPERRRQGCGEGSALAALDASTG